jgi:hypothetical protein
LVRQYKPQKFKGNIEQNTNDPPQGDSVAAAIAALLMQFNVTGGTMLYNVTGESMEYNP